MPDAPTPTPRVPASIRQTFPGVLSQAGAALAAQEWPAAERLCRQILRLDPDHAPAIHLLGLASLRGGCAADAVPLLRRALELDPAQPQWWHQLGHCYLDAKRPAEAAECFRKSLRLQPYSAAVLFDLGQTLSTLGLYPDAAAALAQACRIEPGHTHARALLKTITRRLRLAA